MAYNRAPRRSLVANNQTGPNVSPNSYQVSYEDSCLCKGTNWAPFLTCARQKPTQLNTTPGPDAYYPQINNKIIGGASLSYTAPRFPKSLFLVPAPNEYDPYQQAKEFPTEPPPRLKGFLYHCHVPYTILGYMPSIPRPDHFGYKIAEDRTMEECCQPENDTTLGPAFYHLNFDTFGTCYRGSYWSKYSKRVRAYDPGTPGVGTYDLEPQPSQLQDYLDKLRHQRKKNACMLRYMEKVHSDALRNNYPAPNQYDVGNANKCVRTKRKLVPKRITRPRKPITKTETPAPNQYNDHRTAFDYLVKPSCKKELNAFLTNAPRFQHDKQEGRPAPNQYYIHSFVEDLANKISPYAIRNTAFDTSVPKKLYFLPPDYPPLPKRKRCKCSEIPTAPEPPPPKPNPTYPFSSKADRFKETPSGYDANCASYSIHKAFLYLNTPQSFRKVHRYSFLFKQKRFSRLTGFGSEEDKRYIPGLKYNLQSQFVPSKGAGKFSRAKRFSEESHPTPGPLHYKNVDKGIGKRTFNVSLGGSTPLTAFQRYRMKLQKNPFRSNYWSRKRRLERKGEECPDVQSLNIEFPVSEKVQPKNKKKVVFPSTD